MKIELFIGYRPRIRLRPPVPFEGTFNALWSKCFLKDHTTPIKWKQSTWVRCSEETACSNKNLKSRLQFAKAHIDKPIRFWKNVERWIQILPVRIGWEKICMASKNWEYDSRYTIKTVKHGGGNVMVWAAFLWHSVGTIIKFDTKLDQNVYRDILLDHMIP